VTLRKKLVKKHLHGRPQADIFLAAVVLLNNDLSSIPVAVEMGRLVFDNLKKVILYLMPVRVQCCFTDLV
jgi:magnesium-transporting ATPase (P-type)